jgi:predicted TIM-barrel fold metal-dependent hydrolase
MARVIDIRCRPPVGTFLKMAMYENKARSAEMAKAKGLELAPSMLKNSMELFIEEMDSIGEYMACVSGLKRGIDLRWGWIENDEVYQIVRQYPKRFIGVGCIDGSDRRKALADVDRCIQEYGFKAIVIEPGTHKEPMYPDDRRLYPIYSKCADMGIPLFLMAGGNAGPDMSYSDPVHVEHVAVDFPELNIVVIHGGWPWVTHVLHLAYRRSNIYVCADVLVSFGPVSLRERLPAHPHRRVFQKVHDLRDQGEVP